MGGGTKTNIFNCFLEGTYEGRSKSAFMIHDSSLEVIIPNAGLHRTIQNDRGREGPHKKTIPKHQTSS